MKKGVFKTRAKHTYIRVVFLQSNRQAAAGIVCAMANGKAYFLSMRRKNTKKWLNSIILGASETREPGEGIEDTFYRGLKEELGLERQEIIAAKKYAHSVKSVKNAKGYEVFGWLVEVPFARLERMQKEINSGKHWELGDAKIIKNPNRLPKRELQPHCRKIVKPTKSLAKSLFKKRYSVNVKA